nr:hypothetical protein [Tanacetum cinerariifolium]
MATTIEQQVAMDEALVPSTQRLRIGRSNLRFPSDIQSKESTLQLVYDVLRRCPFFKAFLVTADVPEIYMQELWATAYVVSRHQNTQQYGAIIPIELKNDEIRNTKAYKEYYAFATGEAVPKPKASTRRKRSGSDTSITPPSATTTPKLTAAAKGKQPAKDKSLSDPSEVARTEATGPGSKPGVLDVPTDESEEERSWNSSDDEGTDDQVKDRDDDEGDEGDESDEGEEDADEDKDGDERDDDEENQETAKEEENFDSIPRTPESNKDKGDCEEDQGLNVIKEEHVEEEEEDELYRDVNINQGRGLQATLEVEDTHVTLTLINSDGQQESSSVSSQFMTSMLNRTSDVVAADLSEMELKKILIEKMEGNKSIQRSDEQRNLYKALVDAYEADKTILDSYEETVILKRRRDDDDDQDEGSSTGSDRRSKRQREGKESKSASASLETATRSACRSTIGSKSRQASANESAFVEEPVQTTSQMDESLYLISKLAKQADSRSSFNELLDTPLDFFNFIINRLRVDTLTPELLAGPTYELMNGSCTSLIELEYHLEEVYKATTDQLDWVNPKGQQYPHNLLQPLSLIPDNRGRHVIPFAHFINNNLEYLRGGASSRKYTTSVTKTKAADYGNIKWIEDLGRKRQQFYDFAVNREFALDVYSKRRIIAVTDLKIVEWHSYKHLDWISVRRKLTNLTVEERFAFNVSLRMFTRSIVIQRRVEDLQLGVESYQKRLNLTKSDTYRLMRIDELHKFSDGTLNDVRTTLNDRLKGIRMQYLP